MNRRYSRKTRTSKIKNIILSHIEKNIKEYIIVSIIFLIGVILGVIFINNISENQNLEITNYISSFINDLKENKPVDNLLILKDSIKKNCFLVIALWFVGSTVIGISLVYLIVGFRGFCLGYTISSIILTCGIRKRNIVFNFCIGITIHYIYTLYIVIGCKWNEIAQFNYER